MIDHCRNCKVKLKPRECWLCSDCWRVAIVAPLIVCIVEQVIKHFLP